MRMRGVEVSMLTTPIWVSIAMRQLSTLPLFERESYTKKNHNKQNKTHTYITTATKTYVVVYLSNDSKLI